MPIDAADLLHPRDAPVMPSVLEFTPDTFAETWSWATELVPALRNPGARIDHGINGIFSFTPDGFPLMGESADVKGFWLAEAVWVTHACGVGRSMAEWLVDGGSPTDLHECDVVIEAAPERIDPRRCALPSSRTIGRRNAYGGWCDEISSAGDRLRRHDRA